MYRSTCIVDTRSKFNLNILSEGKDNFHMKLVDEMNLNIPLL